MSLRVIATIPIKPDSIEEARAALRVLVEATRTEEGCLTYDLFESGAAAGVFVTVEEWTDQAALDAHMKTPHIAEAFSVLGGALAGEVGIHPLVPVA